MQTLNAKKQAYHEIKAQTSRAQIFKTTMTNGFYKQAAETYRWRKDAAVSVTVDLDNKLRVLEKQETILLNRL